MIITKSIAIVIGASEWPKSNGRWKAFSGFKNSAESVRDYLQSESGLRIDPENILYLFDDERSASDIDELISNFLEDKEQERPTDIIFYYVGHGAFTQGDQRYSLAVRSTRIEALGQSGYRVSSLAQTFNRKAPDARKFIILDSCFAAAGTEEFIPQSDAAFRMEDQAMDEFVESGTALLCAASADMQALAPADGKFTMFSEALLSSLESGSQKNRDLEYLSLDHIAQMIRRYVREKYRENAVKPELHVPDQRRGDLSSHPIFPNAAFDGLVTSSAETRSASDPIEIRTDLAGANNLKNIKEISRIYQSNKLSILSILILSFSLTAQGAISLYLRDFGLSIIMYFGLLLCGFAALMALVRTDNWQWSSFNLGNLQILITASALLLAVPIYSSQTALFYLALGDTFLYRSIFPGLVIMQAVFWRYRSDSWIDKKDLTIMFGAFIGFFGLYLLQYQTVNEPALFGLVLLFLEGVSIYCAVRLLNKCALYHIPISECIAIIGLSSGSLLITIDIFIGAPWEFLPDIPWHFFLGFLTVSAILWAMIIISSLKLVSGRFEDYYISYAFAPLFWAFIVFYVFSEILGWFYLVLILLFSTIGVIAILRVRRTYSSDT